MQIKQGHEAPWPDPQKPRPGRLGRVLGTSQALVSLILFLILLPLNFPSPCRANDKKNLRNVRVCAPWCLLLRGKSPLCPPAFPLIPSQLSPSIQRVSYSPPPPTLCGGFHTSSPVGTLLGFHWTRQQPVSYLFIKLKPGNSFQIFREKLWTRVWA